MRIENEMLARFHSAQLSEMEMSKELNLSNELDLFFNNVMDSVVDYFTEREEVLVR